MGPMELNRLKKHPDFQMIVDLEPEEVEERLRNAVERWWWAGGLMFGFRPFQGSVGQVRFSFRLRPWVALGLDFAPFLEGTFRRVRQGTLLEYRLTGPVSILWLTVILLLAPAFSVAAYGAVQQLSLSGPDQWVLTALAVLLPILAAALPLGWLYYAFRRDTRRLLVELRALFRDAVVEVNYRIV